MPPALRPLWASVARDLDPDLGPLQRSLARQVPDKDVRILLLFSWFGSGAGPWSGFPAYERIAEDMLLGYSTADLLSAIANRELTVPQTEGVARLFGGWQFYNRRPNDLKLLPAELKARLLWHSLQSDDKDKLDRAQHAFGGL